MIATPGNSSKRRQHGQPALADEMFNLMDQRIVGKGDYHASPGPEQSLYLPKNQLRIHYMFQHLRANNLVEGMIVKV